MRASLLALLLCALAAGPAWALPSGFKLTNLGKPDSISGNILDITFLPNNGYALVAGRTGKIVIADLSGSNTNNHNVYLDLTSATFTSGALVVWICMFLRGCVSPRTPHPTTAAVLTRCGRRDGCL